MAAAMGMTIGADNAVNVDPAGIPTYPLPQGSLIEPTKPAAADTTLQTIYNETYTLQAALTAAVKTARATAKTPEDVQKDAGVVSATAALNTQRAKLATAVDTHRQAIADHTKWSMTTMNDGKYPYFPRHHTSHHPSHIPIGEF